ncbi:hypothetical protein SAMN05421837_104727 [Amycolatopsis pretoriensis]|uniref:Small secreted domain n=1 Tax=Amycolatopsis pretoriensis TaxID=218821 RepID=A0A1H5QUJ8_9PSEU|nr:hypothetical protein [Amycolatopsis pretoriensis]SEF29504.1 hypothetical protein SAMN05421837_104727 [Amycolatopsis pretoriensis]
MIKKIGLITAALAAGAFLSGGIASADTPGGYDDDFGQAGLVNLDNTEVLHNTNVTPGVCGNNVNVLGVQVPIQDSLNGIGVPILSPGEHEADGDNPDNCAAGAITDGGTSQGN